MDRFVINKSFQEVYGVKNNKCPKCGYEFKAITNVVVDNEKAYCVECYLKKTFPRQYK